MSQSQRGRRETLFYILNSRNHAWLVAWLLLCLLARKKEKRGKKVENVMRCCNEKHFVQGKIGWIDNLFKGTMHRLSTYSIARSSGETAESWLRRSMPIHCCQVCNLLLRRRFDLILILKRRRKSEQTKRGRRFWCLLTRQQAKCLMSSELLLTSTYDWLVDSKESNFEWAQDGLGGGGGEGREKVQFLYLNLCGEKRNSTRGMRH